MIDELYYKDILDDKDIKIIVNGTIKMQEKGNIKMQEKRHFYSTQDYIFCYTLIC